MKIAYSMKLITDFFFNFSTKKMSYQVYSDLHMEFYDNIPKFTPEADNLILAGDITTPSYIDKLEELLCYCSEEWKHTYYICGNHEFYGNDDIDVLKLLYRNICNKYENVHFLDNDHIVIDNVAIYGFTGWTSLDKYIIKDGWEYINDFQSIKVNKTCLTPKIMVKISKEELDKFISFIEKINSEVILCESLIVISHFPPIRNGTSSPRYRNSKLQSYFAWNNIMKKIECPKLKIWISGHTHWSYDFIENGVRYFSNQIGYLFEKVKFSNGFFKLN